MKNLSNSVTVRLQDSKFDANLKTWAALLGTDKLVTFMSDGVAVRLKTHCHPLHSAIIRLRNYFYGDGIKAVIISI